MAELDTLSLRIAVMSRIRCRFILLGTCSKELGQALRHDDSAISRDQGSPGGRRMSGGPGNLPNGKGILRRRSHTAMNRTGVVLSVCNLGLLVGRMEMFQGMVQGGLLLVFSSYQVRFLDRPQRVEYGSKRIGKPGIG